jgi:hypothetical protein
MPYIEGTLTVPNKDWKYVYNSILTFINEEISIAHTKANAIYKHIKEEKLAYATVVEDYDSLVSSYTPSTYQKKLIHSSLFSGTNNYLYAPKKNNFKCITNRTTFIDTGSVKIHIRKPDCTIFLKTTNFDNFDDYILLNTFLSEFITMVNTINWPTRKGPSEATRGCVLITIDEKRGTLFYKAGPRPPAIEQTDDYTIEDVTIQEPSHLASNIAKSIRYINTEMTNETSQPVPEVIQSDFDDF